MYGVKANKYLNKKVKFGSDTFDSKLEMERYMYLMDQQTSGHISNLRRQVQFILIPAQTEPEVVHMKTKDKVVYRVVERQLTYLADFVYTKDGKDIIEDTKGFHTPEYICKRKMMRFLGNPIREIKKPTEKV